MAVIKGKKPAGKKPAAKGATKAPKGAKAPPPSNANLDNGLSGRLAPPPCFECKMAKCVCLDQDRIAAAVIAAEPPGLIPAGEIILTGPKYSGAASNTPILDSDWQQLSPAVMKAQAENPHLKDWPHWLHVDDIIPYPNNTKEHSEEQVNKIAGSIAAYGFDQPLSLDRDNVIIKGHGRRLAAKKLGIQMLPVIVRHDLNEHEAMAARIADNRVAESPWLKHELSLELKSLAADNIPLTPLGFDTPELKEYMTFENTEHLGLEDKTPDEAPEPPVVPISQKGDVWILGPHRLMCGDSTAPTDMAVLMGKDKVDLIFTDPPYGVNFEQGSFCPTAGTKFRGTKIANDELKGTGLTDFIAAAFGTGLLHKNDACVVYAWSAPLLPGAALCQGLKDAGIHIQSKIIWAKDRFVLGRCDYHWQHEECWYGYVGTNHQWFGDRNKGSVWNVKRLAAMELHPTQKPWELAEIGINNSSKRGDIVLDLFGGSGFVLIAAERTERCARIMEVEPRWVDTMVRRWCEYTGKDAVRESDGSDWLELKQAQDAADA